MKQQTLAMAQDQGFWLAVIDITGRDFHAQQFAAVVDGDMQFEATMQRGSNSRQR